MLQVLVRVLSWNSPHSTDRRVFAIASAFQRAEVSYATGIIFVSGYDLAIREIFGSLCGAPDVYGPRFCRPAERRTVLAAAPDDNLSVARHVADVRVAAPSPVNVPCAAREPAIAAMRAISLLCKMYFLIKCANVAERPRKWIRSRRSALRLTRVTRWNAISAAVDQRAEAA